jgi:hypothetical protein
MAIDLGFFGTVLCVLGDLLADLGCCQPFGQRSPVSIRGHHRGTISARASIRGQMMNQPPAAKIRTEVTKRLADWLSRLSAASLLPHRAECGSQHDYPADQQKQVRKVNTTPIVPYVFARSVCSGRLVRRL